MEGVLKRDRKRTYITQEDDTDQKGVLLKRFAHQVAGRNPLYCIGMIYEIPREKHKMYNIILCPSYE